MEPIKLNLATYEYVSRGSAFSLIAVASAVVVLFSWFSIQSFFRNQENILETKNRLLSAQKELTKRASAEQGLGADRETEKELQQMRLAMVKRIVSQDIFPWDRFFEMFERMVPDGLYLSKMEPSAAFDHLTLTGGALSPRKVSFFLKRLEESDVFHNSVLQDITIKPAAAMSGGQPAPDEAVIRFAIETDLRLEPFLSGNYSPLIAKYLSE